MTIYSGFSHEKWWFSIAMLVYQRVVCFEASNMFCCIWVDSSYHLVIQPGDNPWYIGDLALSCLTTRDTLPFFVFPFFLFRERKHMIVVALASIVRLLFLCWVKPPFIVQGPTLNGRGRRNHHFLCCFNMLKALQRSWLKHFAYLKNSLIIPQKDNTQII